MSWVNFNDTDVQASTGWGWASNVTQSEYTSGEALTAWDALRMGSDADIIEVSQLTWTNTAIFEAFIWYTSTYNGSWMSFTCAADRVVKSIKCLLSPSWSPVWNITAKVYSDTAWTLVATSTNTYTEWTAEAYFTFTFASDVLWSWTYYIELTTDWVNDATNWSRWHMATSSVYAWWYAYTVTSGGTWTWAPTRDANFEVITSYAIGGVDEDTTKVYKTLATIADKTNFIGFANETVAIDTAVNVNTAWADANQTWLTPWADYYLSDTAWAISTTAWTNEVKIGKAISSSDILIDVFPASWWALWAAFALMAGTTTWTNVALSSWYANNNKFTVWANTVTCNFDWYVQVNAIGIFWTIDNDTNFWLNCMKNGTTIWNQALSTYDNDETDTWAKYNLWDQWVTSVSNWDTISIQNLVVATQNYWKLTIKRLA